jgi:hypothetical protein
VAPGNADKEGKVKIRDRFFIAEGRKAVRQRINRAGRVARKAAKAGLVAGTLAAAGVVSREVRRRRRSS